MDANHTFLANLSLALQIAFVTDNNDWEVIFILDPQNLLLEGHNFLEALSVCNAVDEQEAFSSPHVLLAHSRVFLLAGCIEDI
jgi:hypothetical protein